MNGWRFPKITEPFYVKLIGKPSTKFSKISNASPIFDTKNIRGNRVKSRDLIYITNVQPGVPPGHFPRKSSFLRRLFSASYQSLANLCHRSQRDELLLCFYFRQSQGCRGVCVLVLLRAGGDEGPIQMSHTPCPRCWREKGSARGSTHHGSCKGHCLWPQ